MTKLPITRISKFFGQDDFDLNIQIGSEYMMGDLNMKLVLYRIDRNKTENDSVYAEVGLDEIRYFPPVEFNAIVKVDAPTNKSYKNGLMRYNEPGNLTLQVYLRQLEDLKIDIKYGDFIGYPETENKIRYYTVINDGKVVTDNKHNMWGYKPFYRTITCAIAQEGEFRGI